MRSFHVLVVACGVLLVMAGVTFTLQGYGLLGPQASFMFANPSWIYQGLAVFAIGIIVTVLGGFLLRRSRVGQ